MLEEIPPWEWPSNAGDIFKAALRDRRSPASDRAIAATLGGDLVVMDDEMAGLLLAIVRDAGEPEELRATAAIALAPVLEQTDIEGFDDDISEPPILETTFRQIQETLHRIYHDERVPKEVRRRVLEAAVRAPEDWHEEAIRAAWAGGDEEWKLTAVFGMRWVNKNFDAQILEALKNPNPDIHYEAVEAAGSHALDAAWPHVTALLASEKTEKRLLLAAIIAAAAIRPREAGPLLVDLSDSDDEEIAEAATEAMMMAQAQIESEDDDDDDED